jgi:hypothetical protein
MALIERHGLAGPQLEKRGDLLIIGFFAAVPDGWMLSHEACALEAPARVPPGPAVKMAPMSAMSAAPYVAIASWLRSAGVGTRIYGADARSAVRGWCVREDGHVRDNVKALMPQQGLVRT